MAACPPSRCPMRRRSDRRLRDGLKQPAGRGHCRRRRVRATLRRASDSLPERGTARNCHMVRGRGGVLGPDLSNVGRDRRSGADRTGAARSGSGAAAPAGRGGRGGRGAAPSYRAVTVRLRDGQTLRGIAKNESTFDLQLLAVDGKLHLLSKDQVAEIVREKSLMPKVEASAGGIAQSGRVPQPAVDRPDCQDDARGRRAGTGRSVRRRRASQARLLAHLRRQHERQSLQSAEPDQHRQRAAASRRSGSSRFRVRRARFR